MPYMIAIDAGGTFTDGFIYGDGRAQGVKVDTTPHDPTIGFFNCIEKAAKKLGFETSTALLRQTAVLMFQPLLRPRIPLSLSLGASGTL